jgi:hypothetical protein
MLLVGDSHAGAVAGGVFSAAERLGIAGLQITTSGYRPLLGYDKFGEEDKYRVTTRLVTQALDAHPEIRTVLVVGYWNQAVNDDTYLNAAGVRVPGSTAVQQGLGALMKKYPDRAFIFSTAPAVSKSFGASAAARAVLFGRDQRPAVPREQLLAMERTYKGILVDLASRPNGRLVDITSALCDASLCFGRVGKDLAYLDDNHLSEQGAQRISPILYQAFRSATTPPHGG